MSRSRSQARCCSTSPVREKCALSEAAEMDRCSRENAELRMLMEKYEKHLTELQGSLKTLTTERDRLAQLYDQAKEDLQRARRESINNSKNARICVSTQALLQRVEDERDLALSDLRRIAGERDALKDKLKTTLETCQNERIRIEQKLDEFETMVHNLEAERKECIQRNLSLKDTVLTLEDQLKSLTMQITDSNNQIGDLKAANHALRNSNEDLLHLREDSSRRLNAKENEILSYQDKVIELESRLNDAVRTGQVFKEDVIHLKQTVVSLNSEKEQLQNLVDNKAEKMESLFEDLSMKNRKLDEFTAELRDLENVLSQTQNDLAVREREMKTLRRQLDSYSEDITEVQRCRDSAIRENERLQEDLTLLTKENQALRHDLEEFAVDRAGLRQQVQDYINEVGRAEGMLSEKEQERTDLLNQYKEQNVELTRMKNTILELEGEVAQIQYELGSKSKENRRMHELAEQFERETRQARDAQQNAEMQLSNCNRDLQRAEETIQRLDTENTNIMKDMAALREICSKLNCTKEDLSRTLGKKTLDNEEMHNLLAELKAEVELLRNQLGAERANAKSLEGIIATFREKEFQQELCSQEKSAEIQLLRDRMTLNDTKSGNQGRELSNLRSRALELEAEVDRLRRQLTNERFERERAAQELRRHGITPPPVADSSLCMNHAHSPSRSARLAGHGTNTNRDRDRDYYP